MSKGRVRYLKGNGGQFWSGNESIKNCSKNLIGKIYWRNRMLRFLMVLYLICNFKRHGRQSEVPWYHWPSCGLPCIISTGRIWYFESEWKAFKHAAYT